MTRLDSGTLSRPTLFLGLLAALLLVFPLQAPASSEPVSSEIQQILKSGKHPKLRWGNFADVSKILPALYAPAYAPLWTRDGVPTAQAKAILEVLSLADDVGLNAADYDVGLLSEWIKSSTLRSASQESAAFDVAMSVAVSRYAGNVALGRINPKSVGFALDVEPRRPLVLKALRELPQATNPKGLLAGLEPDFPIYRPLKEALVRYRRLAVEIPKARFAFPAKFTPGMTHPDVPALRKLLTALGDFPVSAAAGSDTSLVYDPALVAAVKAFQIRHGIGDDGVIGKGTLSRLVVPVPDRLKQIQLGLERLRWLPANVKGLYLIVNIPAFKLYGARAGEGIGQHELQMNVVVGEAIDGRNTPVFHSEMTTVTFRPYWNVPEAIAAKEIVPALLKQASYLTKNNMEIVPNFAQSAQVLEPSHDTIERLAAGAVRVRQKPGPENALGLYKFSFPNTNNVYLHSTPSKGLFNRDRRDFSHGCIRVQDPLALAQWVLEENGDWSRERIEAFANGEVTKTINLKRAIPVYILYSTVMADPQGRISFYEDIYGHDRTLQVLLARGFPYGS